MQIITNYNQLCQAVIAALPNKNTKQANALYRANRIYQSALTKAILANGFKGGCISFANTRLAKFCRLAKIAA
jgi:hypothetical protein